MREIVLQVPEDVLLALKMSPEELGRELSMYLRGEEEMLWMRVGIWL